jgi:hypothetical protein
MLPQDSIPALLVPDQSSVAPDNANAPNKLVFSRAMNASLRPKAYDTDGALPNFLGRSFLPQGNFVLDAG